MDISQLYRELIRKNLEDKGEFDQAEDRTNVIKPDKLTIECLDINGKIHELYQNLVKIRPLYLSNTRATSLNNSLSEKQRDDIDYETRLIIQTQAGKIRQLEDLERARAAQHEHHSTLKRLLADPRAEGSSKTLGLHRIGMFWYLNHELKIVSDFHASQQEIRLSRQMEKAKANLHNAPFSVADLPPELETEPVADLQLAPEQIQQLENETSALLEELELTHDKVKNAQKSMQEISELQTGLATHLATQSDRIQSLLEDATQTHVDIDAANQQLSSAKTRNRRSSKIIIWSSVAIGVILLVNDAMLG